MTKAGYGIRDNGNDPSAISDLPPSFRFDFRRVSSWFLVSLIESTKLLGCVRQPVVRTNSGRVGYHSLNVLQVAQNTRAFL